MSCLEKGLEHRPSTHLTKLKQKCKIHAYCAMSNHFHQVASYRDGSTHLSLFMRQAHALFGIKYNRAKRRSGKVAEGRPKTPLIQDPRHEMLVHFYVEANPIRAGFRNIENLKYYQYSSYGFFAYGRKTKYTHLLTLPDWYMKLGKTLKERQQKYRKLFRQYLGEHRPSFSCRFKQAFIGDAQWILMSMVRLKKDNREFENESYNIQSDLSILGNTA
ncbi:MAG: hypothetical protein RJB66_367 [Pseudomonadota bacterium]